MEKKLTYENAKAIIDKFSNLTNENGFPCFIGFQYSFSKSEDFAIKIQNIFLAKPTNIVFSPHDESSYVVHVFEKRPIKNHIFIHSPIQGYLMKRGIEFDINPYLV